MKERVLLKAGRRDGRTFDNESEFIAELDAGREVFVSYNGIYFQVLGGPNGMTYTALTEKPEGV